MGLLAAKERIHDFVKAVLSERELHDVIVFAAFALMVLPEIRPSRPYCLSGQEGPFALKVVPGLKCARRAVPGRFRGLTGFSPGRQGEPAAHLLASVNFRRCGNRAGLKDSG